MGEVETMDDLKEELEESLQKGPKDPIWQELMEAMQNKTIYQVKVLTTVKGGVTVDIEGIRGFIPASQLSTKYVEDLDSFINKTLDVVPIKVNEEENSLVLSHREVERAEKAKEREALKETFKVGETYEGKVESLQGYGAFVDLGNGIKGLLHISRISNKRINHPGEVLKEGQDVKVKLIDIKDGKFSLSMKEFDEKHPVIEEATDEEEHVEYTEEDISTSLGGLLKNIKL